MDIDPVKSISWMNVHYLSQSLLDLLKITHTDRKRFLQPKEDNPRKSLQYVETKTSISPISLATRLVSSATALYKECNVSEKFWQNLNGRNNQILSSFSPNNKSFDAKQLDDTRLLILRVLLAVCHTCHVGGIGLEEVFGSEYVSNLIDAIKAIFNKYGHEVSQEKSSAAFMENFCSDPFLKATGEKDVDQFLLRQLFCLKTLLKIFDTILSAIDSSDADAHEITRLVSLLQEFQHSGGYHILKICVQSLVHKITYTIGDNLSSSTEVDGSPRVNKNNTSIGLDSQLSLVEQKLRPVFKVFGDMCKLVKQLKTNYLHGIKCRRRCHRHCDLSILPHQHHDILGINISRYEVGEFVANPTVYKTKGDMKGGSTGVSQGGDFIKKPSKRMKKDLEAVQTPSFCVIGTAVNFLLRDIFPISPLCVRFGMSTLDTIGICHCIRPCSFVVPLLSSLQQLEPVHQDIVLATVGRALLQRMDTSSQEPKHISDRDTNCTVCTPSFELPSDYPTLIVPWYKTDNSYMPSICEDANTDAGETSAKQIVTNNRLPNFATILEKTDKPHWLCLACYKDLLLDGFVRPTNELESTSGACNRVMLAAKVCKHLASVTVHFDEESLCILLTTAMLPVLHFVSKNLSTDDEFTAAHSESEDTEAHFKQNHRFSLIKKPYTSIIVNLLKVLSVGLSEKKTFRKIFIRHSGVKLLCSFLPPYLYQCDSMTVRDNRIDTGEDYCGKIFDAASTCIELILRNASDLTLAVKKLILPIQLADHVSHSTRKGEVSDHTEPSTLLSRIVKGIRKSPKDQHRDSSRLSNSQTGSPEAPLIHVTFNDETVDEKKVFHSECSIFLSTVMQALWKMTNVEEDACSFKSDEEFEHIDDVGPIDECGATSTKSSGYQSKSRKSSSAASNQNIGADLLQSSIERKSTCLPDYDVFQMEQLQKMCSLVSAVIQDNDVALREFCDLNGSKAFLQILMSTAVSLDLVKKNVGVAQTFSGSSSENYSYETLNEDTKDSLEEARSLESIDIAEVESTSSRDSEESAGIATSKNNPDEGEVEKDSDDEGQRDVENTLRLKLKILSSALSICLLCSKNNCDSDMSTEDIVSMLKSSLQRSQLMCTKYCKLLCTALFESSVKPRIPVVKSSSIQATMQLLKQRIFSRKNSQSPCEGNRYSLSSRNDQTRHRTHSIDSDDSNPSRQNGSSIRNEVEEMNLSPTYDLEDPSDGYQGDTESDACEDAAFSLFGHNMENVSESLIEYGLAVNPELIEILTQLLGDAGRELLSVDNSDESSLLLTSLPVLSYEKHLDNIRSVVCTTASLIQFNQRNFDTMLNNSDLPLAFMESFCEILQQNCEEEHDIRQRILELCLMFNMELMSAEHLRLVLSFFNSENPPMDQLLKYLLVLVNNLHAGPGHYLQFPVEGKPVDCPSDDPLNDRSQDAKEAYTLSVWKIAPLRLPIKGNVRWPTSNVGLTISLWLQVGSFGYLKKQKSDVWGSYGDFHHNDAVADIDHKARFHLRQSVDFDPYHHLVSIGTKQSMLQIWLEGGTLIFRICVDAQDDKPVGVLAQTECPGLVSVNGEWQHITFTYTENQLPDKTILGKVHAIVNCTNEIDIILEHTMPSNNKGGIISRKNTDCLTLFVGHWIRPVQTKFCLQNSPGYRLGTIMVFDGIHFTIRSAFAIYRKGPDISNLTECLERMEEGILSASVSSKVRLSHSMNFAVSPMGSPTSPARSFGFGSFQQFFPLPHSFLVSDLASEEFFTDRTLPNSISLQEHLVLTHCPTDPMVYLCNPTFAKPVETKKRSRSFSFFSSSTSSNASNHTEEFDPLSFQSMQMQVEQLVTIASFHNMGLHRSLNQVGGVQVFLMLCAKVIEITAESLSPLSTSIECRQAERIQSFALRTLLDLRRADSKRHEEFFSQNIAAMLHKLLTKPQALVGFHALQIIFNATCSGDDVILSHDEKSDDEDDHFEINEENSALLHDQELIQVFLTDWQIWHKAVNFNDPRDPLDNFLVWSLLLDGLLNLVGVNHPHQWHNCKSLMQVGIVEKVLKGLQKLIFDDVKPFPGRIVTSKIIELLRILAGSPPDVSILSKICDFLVATHPPASTFVCHSPSSFYFNLRSLKAPTSRTFTLSTNPMQTHPVDRSPEMAEEGLSVEQLSTQMSAAAQIKADDPDVQHERFQADVDREMPCSTNRDSFSNHINSISSVASRRSEGNNMGSIKSESRADSSWEDLPHVMHSIMTTPTASEFTSFKKEDCSACPINIGQSSFAEGTSVMHSFHSIEESQYSECEDEISYVISELLGLLFVAVRIMPDMDAFELTTGPLCAKCLIVGIHHNSSDVRADMIKLLAAYFSRCSKKTQDEFLQEKGFHLVANQIHQHIVSRAIVESCLYFLFGRQTSSMESLPFDRPGTDSGMLTAPDTFSNHAVILLLATLTQTTHDAQLCEDVVTRLQELFESIGPAADVMLDNGLTLALCNLLLDILSPSCVLLKDEKEAVLKEVQHFMTCIAVKACVTAGSAHFQVRLPYNRSANIV